jgi:hypothetical protein
MIMRKGQMPFTVKFSAELKNWFDQQERPLQRTVLFTVALLEQYGPQLSRPYADTLKGSSLKNLKELRVQHRGEPYRILYAFDPKREALLLIGGNKASDKRWYERMIKQAEAIFEVHLQALEKEDNDDEQGTTD